MIVFPMAGLSSRFSEKGYKEAKFKLPIWGTHVFDLAVASFRAHFADQKFLFICREEPGTLEFIQSRIGALNILDAAVISLEHVTAGQAETVAIGLKKSNAGLTESLDIFNVDTFRLTGRLPVKHHTDADGALEVFDGSGSNWSFVKPSTEAGIVEYTTEKVPVSNLCCTGYYNFSTVSNFLKALSEETKSPSSKELYIAPVYNHLIRMGKRIEYVLTDRALIEFCGVPEEYEALLRAPRPSVYNKAEF